MERAGFERMGAGRIGGLGIGGRGIGGRGIGGGRSPLLRPLLLAAVLALVALGGGSAGCRGGAAKGEGASSGEAKGGEAKAGEAKAGEAAKEEAAAVAVELAPVERRDVRETLAVDGSLVAREGATTRLAPAVAGRLVEVRVKEGDRVAAGEVVARIDGRSLAAVSESAAAGAAAASATAAQSALALRAARADQEAAVRAARLALDVAVAEGRGSVEAAEADLRRLRAGARPQEVAQARLALESARIARDKARLDAERDRRLLAEGLVAGSQADASRAGLLAAESGVATAGAALDLVRAGSRPEEIRAAEGRLRSARDLAAKRAAGARAALAQARAGTLSVAARAQEAAASRLAAQGRAADARAAAAGASGGLVRSPFAGVVVRRFLNPGDSADPTTPVLTVSAARRGVGGGADFVGSVSPLEARRVAPGLAVLLEGGGAGRVVSVGESDPGTGLVPVRVRLAGSGARAGGFVSGRIVLATLQGVAAVPKGAVLLREGKAAVFVARDGTARLTPVVLGPEENGFVAIRKGVAPGARVVVLGGHELSDGAKIEEAEKTGEKAGEKKGAGEAP